MEMPSVRRRQEFTFAGSPLREFERVRPPRPPGNAVLPRAGEEEESRWLQQPSRLGSPESAASGTPSPQLWGQGQYQQQHRLYPASAGSSPSRAQAIAGYRREMLDLVRGLPESAYELSLRDIVDRAPPSPPPPSQPLLPPPSPPPPPASQQQEAMDEKQSKKQGRKQRRAMGRTRSRSLERSVSLDTGLLIKLFLPLSVGGSKKKKVSPKPPAAKDSGDKKAKTKKKKQGRKEAQEEEEWWKKSEFSEAGSSSRTSSTNSTSTDASAGGNGNGNGAAYPKAPTRSRSRKRNGCYGFFRANKSPNGGIQD